MSNAARTLEKIKKATPYLTMINGHTQLSKQDVKCYVRKFSLYALKQNS
jgi:hypothetical protein